MKKKYIKKILHCIKEIQKIKDYFVNIQIKNAKLGLQQDKEVGQKICELKYMVDDLLKIVSNEIN